MWRLMIGEPSPLGNLLGKRGSACVEGDDHLAWKHPVSLEMCRGLRTIGGFHSYTWVHLWTFKAAIVTIRFGYSLCSLLWCDQRWVSD
ncbi:hypothetical protein CK203_115064 [Vitis vinifera]|uniref:Uncharacterized protein n=1 Tax=Vitis vinifera TaxID=29760 RepID=A0A438EC85_VITVI|nr:hypothetical protein CK203_115064 [Vitis vinifera]